MAYKSTFGGVRNNFFPNIERGHWGSPTDFIYAGVALAFRLDIYSRKWLFYTYLSLSMFVYLLSIFIYIVPFIILQSFLGQFSSSGYISAFRLTPIFKGIGYISLVLNVFVVIFYSIFATLPLVYIFGSMLPAMPWSCQGYESWAKNVTKEEVIKYCDLPNVNITQSSNESVSSEVYYRIPSALYFNSFFRNDLYENRDEQFTVSWQLIFCNILIWSLIGLFIYKYFNTKKFGEIIRYTVKILCGLLVLLLIRFNFLPNAQGAYYRLGHPVCEETLKGLYNIPIYSLSAFGPGWGLFITLASFNKFQTNITKQSWFIGFGQFAILFGLDLLALLTEQYLDDYTSNKRYTAEDYVWFPYLYTANVMLHMEWSNMWSLLFYIMLFLANMLLILIQIYTILITVFDELVVLRKHKLEVSLGLIIFIAVMSLYFTSSHGVNYVIVLLTDTYITQIALNGLLIIIVLWIYGHVHFKRDIEFMLGKRFATWKIYILKYMALIGTLVSLIIGIYLAHLQHNSANSFIDTLVVIFIIIPWLSIPIYAVINMRQISGSLKTRFQYLCRSIDWHPAGEEHQHLYAEAKVHMGTNYQLNHISNSNE